MRHTRRRLLGALGVGVVGLAGCLGDGSGSDDPTGTTTDGDATDGDDATTDDDGGTSTADDAGTFEPDHERAVWGYRTGSAVRLGPAVVDGTVYVGTADGRLHALTPEGRRRWTYDTGTAFYQPKAADRSPLVVDAGGERLVLFVSGDPSGAHGDGFALHAVDAASGAGRWTHVEDGLKFLSLLGTAGGHAYVGTGDDTLGRRNERLRAVSLADGAVDWAAEVGDVRDSVVTGDAVYVTSYAGLDAVGADGAARWSVDYDGTPLDPGVVGETVVGGVRDPDRGAAVGYAAADGTERWRVGRDFFVTSVVTTGDAAFVGGEHVVAVGPDGAERWRYDPGALVTGCPVVDGTLYAGSGTVVALDVASGTVRWSFRSPAEYGSAVAVGTDRVVVDRQGVPAVDVVSRADGTRLFAVEGRGDEGLPATALGETVVVADGGGDVLALR